MKLAFLEHGSYLVNLVGGQLTFHANLTVFEYKSHLVVLGYGNLAIPVYAKLRVFKYATLCSSCMCRAADHCQSGCCRWHVLWIHQISGSRRVPAEIWRFDDYAESGSHQVLAGYKTFIDSLKGEP